MERSQVEKLHMMARRIWTHYFASSEGGAIEYVLLTAGIAAMVLIAIQNPDLKAFQGRIWENLFASANQKTTF